jgi:FecR protein
MWLDLQSFLDGQPIANIASTGMKRVLLSFLVVAGLMALIPLQAQDNANANVNANVDPDGQYEPGRAVARISVLNGDVSVRRGDSGDVVAAAVNGPLMADDRLLTSSSGRAEVQLDSANMIRIGPNSEVRFTGMDVRSFQVQVAMGTVTFRTLRPSQAQVEVDTPSVAVRPMRPGAYRVTVHEDGTSEITVRSGEAEVDSQRGGERLQAGQTPLGQTMDARGPAADAEFQVVQPVPYDAFDRWNDDRDRFILSSQSYQRVSPDIGGAEDLDQNGQWVQDPNYGSVWQPTNVGPDWAPYQNGRWVWEDYYGWTWVSYDPWGWAPYHYGRWFMGAGGWCWYPGPILGHPLWAPAYVGFFGFGGGLGIGVGFGFGGVGAV